MKAALRRFLFVARAHLALAFLRAAIWTADCDFKPANAPAVAPPPDPITPEAEALFANDPPTVDEVEAPREVGRRTVRG